MKVGRVKLKKVRNAAKISDIGLDTFIGSMVYCFVKKMRNAAKISRRASDAVRKKTVYGSVDPKKR